MRKDVSLLRRPGLLWLPAFVLPSMSYAQTIDLADKSTSLTDLFLRAVNWGLLAIILAGLLTMPLVGRSWYKRNRADHTWVDFFKSGNFAIRISIIILAFILWIFKIIDYVTHKFL
ncbi:MAG: hypothetical protein Q7S53_01405 [bacterium]|nr:hypothetical protein [bacterium]